MRKRASPDSFCFPPSTPSLPRQPPSAVNGCAVLRFAPALSGDGGGFAWPSEGIGTGKGVRMDGGADFRAKEWPLVFRPLFFPRQQPERTHGALNGKRRY